MKRKNIYIILIATIVIITLSLVFYYFKKNSNKMTINTGKEKIEVTNVYKNPVEIFKSGVEFKKNSDYLIDYYSPDQLFIIIITNPNISEARKRAEKDFLDTLSINQEQACKLNIQLGVPFNVNEVAAGINFGLSFCPNGIAFPK